LLICLTILILGGATLYLFFERLGQVPSEARSRQALATLPRVIRPPRLAQLLVHTSADGQTLHPQFIELATGATPRSERIALVVDTVLRSAALWLATPASSGGLELPFTRRAAYEVGDEIVVDLARAPDAPDLDFRSECLLIYGIVNSLADNFEEVHGVRFLINGARAETLSGALDISTPLVPNVALQVTP
jgi:hypothetical protein